MPYRFPHPRCSRESGPGLIRGCGADAPQHFLTWQKNFRDRCILFHVSFVNFFKSWAHVTYIYIFLIFFFLWYKRLERVWQPFCQDILTSLTYVTVLGVWCNFMPHEEQIRKDAHEKKMLIKLHTAPSVAFFWNFWVLLSVLLCCSSMFVLLFFCVLLVCLFFCLSVCLFSLHCCSLLCHWLDSNPGSLNIRSTMHPLSQTALS